MQIKEINNKHIWEKFLLDYKDKTFLQSWNWGEFQRLIGNKFWRFGIYDENSNLLGIALIVKIIAKRGTFLLIQHGPNLKILDLILKFKTLKFLLENLKKIAKKEKASFIRIASLFKKNKENEEIFRNLGFRQAPMHANAYDTTLKLDISLSEENLLMNMRKTTRYLIRQAQKNSEIEIIKTNKIKDVEIFNQLNLKTAEKQHFIPFSYEFIKKEFDVFFENDQVLLFFGKHQGKIIAACLVIFWSNIAFYHQSAFLPQYSKIPIIYLIMWEAIKESKKRGCELYDFWGFVDFSKNPKHPWAGPSFFKKGFGGEQYEYIKPQDFIISKKYWLTYIFETIRRIKRKLN